MPTVTFTSDLLRHPLFRKPERMAVLLAMELSREVGHPTIPVGRICQLTGLSEVTVERSLQDLRNYPVPFGTDGAAPVKEKPKAVAKADAEKPSRFVKPTVEDVAAYIQKKGYTFAAEEFWNYFESVGWVVGKSRKPMKSWTAACATFQRNENKSYARESYSERQLRSRQIYAAAEVGAAFGTDVAGLLDIPDEPTCEDLAHFLSSADNIK